MEEKEEGRSQLSPLNPIKIGTNTPNASEEGSDNAAELSPTPSIKSIRTNGLEPIELMREQSDVSIWTELSFRSDYGLERSSTEHGSNSIPEDLAELPPTAAELSNMENTIRRYSDLLEFEVESIQKATQSHENSKDEGELMIRPPVMTQSSSELSMLSEVELRDSVKTPKWQSHHEGEALDIVVVRAEDGTLRSTDFHVNFSHMKLSMKHGYKKALKALGKGFSKVFKDFGKNAQKRSMELGHVSDPGASFLEKYEGYPVQIYINDTLTELEMVIDDKAMLYFEQDQFEEVEKGKGRCAAPTSKQLELLGLKPGKNAIRFETTFSNGKKKKKTQVIHAEASCFLWDFNSKIILCDIDGTITKTDVGGLVGGSMAPENESFVHDGICPLLNGLVKDDVKIMFVTSRPLMLKKVTKMFLSTISQNGKYIPEGPLFNCPQSLFNVVYQEVITKTIHKYKTGVIARLQCLFEESGRSNPQDLYRLGFGNKPTDAQAYEAVKVRPEFIFIIDKVSNIVVWGTKLNEKDGLTPMTFNGYEDEDLLPYIRTALKDKEKLLPHIDSPPPNTEKDCKSCTLF
mmetsp:Transcript_33086/g.43558  ORF Transcript_33086/g.43558 Transcript_33086/m.43558 type:complete len:574 (-) Transcript_33086:217-1938(-)|eukprot:CAMPEP_0117751306 /NCGR_PEP_ID=MMETSP0947-20121206/10891_1 /TAXON_ID=44440 /ORGANISM="Chattonella subsalsa, Strain CCMP2191" /LENGTH=573 /DNA_ID=CAMNT_0005569651 /DNA_START=162 /DNA_END=1883 /DNA_ORIENTATION=-